MSANSKIEWTDASWTAIRAVNKATGKVGWHCEHATTGCINCYSEGFNLRLGTGLPFKPGHRKDIRLVLDEEMLAAPLKWRKPRMVFVCSMTDLFGDFVEEAWIIAKLAVMALADQHDFQVLTKRSGRMRQVLNDPATPDKVEKAMDELAPEHWCKRELDDVGGWPLKNVWNGVSAENQEQWDARVEDLGATQSALRFVSVEPMLGPIDAGNAFDAPPQSSSFRPIDWVICGGESGPGARPMHPDWARSLRDQCQSAGVSFFFKQWGAWGPGATRETKSEWQPGTLVETRTVFGHPAWVAATAAPLSPLMERFGKKAAGRLLDGREWNEMPIVKEKAAA